MATPKTVSLSISISGNVGSMVIKSSSVTILGPLLIPSVLLCSRFDSAVLIAIPEGVGVGLGLGFNAAVGLGEANVFTLVLEVVLVGLGMADGRD